MSIITIDGPAASGKSTVGQQVAAKLGYLYVDTGVMYRAVTLAVLQRGIRVDDQQAVTQLAQTINLDIQPPSKPDSRQYDVLVDQIDVTWAIRSDEVNANVSLVSTYPGVRKAMGDRQRKIGLRGNIVMVGRDIGTVILPEADVKIYLDASVEARAQRRYQELVERGEKADFGTILDSMRLRDQIDSSRRLAPLRPAPDALVLDSTDMTVDEVVKEILDELPLEERVRCLGEGE